MYVCPTGWQDMVKQQHQKYCLILAEAIMCLILADAVFLTLAAVCQEDNAQCNWANVHVLTAATHAVKVSHVHLPANLCSGAGIAAHDWLHHTV